MKSLVFGINGQDGVYLRQLLAERGVETIGVSRSEGDWIRGDISDLSFVEELVKKEQPDIIFHFAASSTTKHSALFENHEYISTGTLNVLESVKRHSPGSRVFITGSGVQFKNLGQGISELSEFEASSPYAIARIQSVFAARYFRKLGIKTYVGYLFHHESPLRKDNHVSKLIVNAVKRIKQGSDEKIKLGEISVRKEWGFAKDIIEGIWTLVNQDDIYEASIGTGLAYSIQDWLEVCFRQINKDWHEYVVLEKNYTPEYNILFSNPATINACGWYPATDFEGLAKIMMA